MFQGKKILLGITGSIAAYKSLLLVRLLVKEGASVKVIQTPSSRDFVTPLSLATLSKNETLSEIFQGDTWANHVEWGRWADLMLIAPLSCNTLAKMAQGHCDNLLLATYLSATCPVVVAPAMDEDMWRHPATQANLQRLLGFGNKVIPVEKGELASGLFGEGRMAEPETILAWLRENFFLTGRAAERPISPGHDGSGSRDSGDGNGSKGKGQGSSRGERQDLGAGQRDLEGKKALVTAGPTYEAIDPVRYISNHSSGKMGIAIAKELAERGAQVNLVLGPTSMAVDIPGVTVRRVVSAEDMYKASIESWAHSDMAVMAAAVADYTPAVKSAEKIKKKDESLVLQLARTPDILMALGGQKKEGQVLVGFALETSGGKDYALDKLKSKNADLIVLNSLADEGAGFGFDTNQVTIFDRKGGEITFERKPKQQVAKDIVDRVVKWLYA